MDTNTNAKPRSSLRILKGLIAAKESLYQRTRDLGGLFELTLFRRHVDRVETGVVVATAGAAIIVVQERQIETTLREITAPESEGGVAITPNEHRRLARNIFSLRKTAISHHANLNELSS